ncbi:lysozyme inhibitor LprI family protein [Chitinophaga sp. MM2321]|uniref:lysozyme inhibitor LprI family protein n=1 Tax=Chitinophaga sp. MM2321 TaxID=3137178 RepID=UPI0032D5A593
MKSLFMALLLMAGSFTGFAQSQAEMNKQAAQEYKDVDKKMNTVYQLILKDYAANKTFINNFKDAQRLWVQLRDAQLKAMYPESAKSYGSVFPMCKANYLAELTNQRLDAIKVWINDTPQGDVCTGSINVKQ